MVDDTWTYGDYARHFKSYFRPLVDYVIPSVLRILDSVITQKSMILEMWTEDRVEICILFYLFIRLPFRMYFSPINV
jgi:hypothetical protein